MDARPDDRPARCAPARCAWCGHPLVAVAVHGHVQCARCGVNVDPCCGGETADPSPDDDGPGT